MYISVRVDEEHRENRADIIIGRERKREEERE
jgi:hypothetical protein